MDNLVKPKRAFQVRDDQTIFETMRFFNNFSSQFNDFYAEQTDLYDATVSALMWDKKIRDQKKKAGMVANSYNLVRTILNVIFSIERDNRKKSSASPIGKGDREFANMVSKTLDYYLYHADFSKTEKKVFMDTIIARLGVRHIGWRYEGSQDMNGSLYTEACDPREFIWEPFYNDPLWERSGSLMRKSEMDLEEILNKFALGDQEMITAIENEARVFFEADPQRGKWVSRKLKALMSATYEMTTGSTLSDNSFRNYLQWWNPGNGRFDILELHEKRTQKRLMIRDSERQKLVDISDAYATHYQETTNKQFLGYDYQPEIIDKVKQTYGLKGAPDVDLVPMKFLTTVIPAFMLKVNEQPYPFPTKYYTYIPQYCYDSHADPMKVQSVMDDLKDPQMDFNKAKSLILELLARYSNKGWIMDENAIDGVEEDWTTNRIAPYRRVRTGYIGQIKPEPAQTISPELIAMPIETQQLMRVISNADNEIRGQGDSNVKSGKHFIAKEQRQAKSFTYVLENHESSQRATYEMALDFIKHYVKTQQVIRITSDVDPTAREDQVIVLNQKIATRTPEGQLAWKVVNDISAYDYDIQVSDAPFSASAQDERRMKLGEIFNAAAEINPKRADAMLPIMVRVTGGPEADEILKAWETLDNPSPQQQQLQQVAQKIQMIMAKLGIEEKQTEIEGKKLDNVKKAQEVHDNVLQYLPGGEGRKDKETSNKKNKKEKEEVA